MNGFLPFYHLLPALQEGAGDWKEVSVQGGFSPLPGCSTGLSPAPHVVPRPWEDATELQTAAEVLFLLAIRNNEGAWYPDEDGFCIVCPCLCQPCANFCIKRLITALMTPAITLSLSSHLPSRIRLRARPLDVRLLPDPADPGKVPPPHGPSPVLPELPPARAPRGTRPGPRGRAGVQEVTGLSPRARSARPREGSRSSTAQGTGSQPGLAALPRPGKLCGALSEYGKVLISLICATL